MSFILDALRRADAEREQGAVPGLHAQPVPQLSPEPRPRARAQQPWAWVALGAVAAPLVVLAWYFAARPSVTPRAELAAPPPSAATETAGGAPAVPAARPAPLEPAGPVAMPAPVPAPAEPRRPPATVAATRPPETHVPAPVEQAEPPRIVAREELPDAVRRELPELVPGGSIYSSNPANRSLILNGRLFREHEAITADVSLEEIRLKSAVLRFKGYLFEIRY